MDDEQFYSMVDENTKKVLGLLSVAALSNPEVKEAHRLVIDIGTYLYDWYVTKEEKTQ